MKEDLIKQINKNVYIYTYLYLDIYREVFLQMYSSRCFTKQQNVN